MTPRALSRASAAALLRFHLVSEVLAGEQRGQSRAEAVRAVARRKHVRMDGTECTVGVRTLYRWLAKYGQGQLGALEPKARRRTETSDALPARLIEFLRSEKTSDPRASVPELLRRARERDVIAREQKVDRATVWRALCRMGLPTRRRRQKREGDMRRFAYPHRMQMVLCDGKHFRAGPSRLRRVALFFLDDSTRFGLDVVVVPSESSEAFLRALFGVLTRYGLMDILYLDHGPGFISDDTFQVLDQLHRLLIHGASRYPEGHGKIERFNQTAQNDVLCGLDGAPDVDPSCESLTLRLRHYLQLYNDRPHESLDGDSPRKRWEADTRELIFPQDEATLREDFIVTEKRTVSSDHIVRQGGALYEVPMGMAREKALVRRQVFSGELSVLHEGRLVTLHPVDLARNARAQRGQRKADERPETEPVKTAGALAFDKEFAPIVDDDGGFSDKE